VKCQFDWDGHASDREFQRAIELNPNYASAFQWRSATLTALGRIYDAIASVRRAHELDPLALIITTHMGWELYFARRYDESLEHIQKALDMASNYAPALLALGLTDEQKGLYADATTAFQKALDLFGGRPSTLGALAHAYAVSGNRAKALRALADLDELSKRRYVTPHTKALIYAGLSDKEHAFTLLEQASRTVPGK
jgi:tetratricopeptide (TPR) repeat protein